MDFELTEGLDVCIFEFCDEWDTLVVVPALSTPDIAWSWSWRELPYEPVVPLVVPVGVVGRGGKGIRTLGTLFDLHVPSDGFT